MSPNVFLLGLGGTQAVGLEWRLVPPGIGGTFSESTILFLSGDTIKRKWRINYKNTSNVNEKKSDNSFNTKNRLF